MLHYLVFALVAVAVADVTHDGPCPQMTAVEKFNVTAYQGVWYEISKFPTDNEKGGKCSQAEYKVDGDLVNVKNTHILDGVQTFIEGVAKFADDADNAAKLIVTFKFGDVVRESPLMILATNYNGYSVAYNCKYDEKTKTHRDTAWILSRTMKLEGEAKTEVDNFLKTHEKEIDASKFEQTDFSEEACKFTSTSLITEPSTKKQ